MPDIADDGYGSWLRDALSWTAPDQIGSEFVYGRLSSGAPILFSVRQLLDLIVARWPTHPQLRLVRSGTEVPLASYHSRGSGHEGFFGSRPDVRRLSALLRDGATLVLDALDEMDKGLALACRSLQWWAHELVQVNAYLTTRLTRGFDLHWDDHDVIIVQVSGTKEWDIRGPTRAFPMRRDLELGHEPETESVWNGTIRPGEVLHIPRGYWHSASGVGEGHSLHLTFGITRRTGTDWLLWAADRARSDSIWRENIPRDLDARRAYSDRLATKLADVVALSSMDDFLREREMLIKSRGGIHVFEAEGVPEFVRCETDFRPLVEDSNDSIAVLAEGFTIRLSEKARPALPPLLSGHPVSLPQLSNSVGFDVSPIAKTLLDCSICVPVRAS